MIPAVTPEPNALITPEPEPSQEPTPLPTMTPKPTPVPTTSTKATPLPSPSKLEIKKQVYFKVRVGSYNSRNEAEKTSRDLKEMGYEVSLLDEPEGTYVQLGSFKDQERALTLAEEISQKGYSVIIRQIEE